MKSPEVVWTYNGVEYRTNLDLSISLPNPHESVVVSCVLEGHHNYDVTVKFKSCGGISGSIDAAKNFSSSNGMGPVGTKVDVRLFQGLVSPGSSSQVFEVYACCRVGAISGGVNGTDDYLNVTLENYLEVRTYNLFGVVIAPYSPTKKTILKVNKS